jgi:probable F420-dependent oxidoreductase
VLLGPIGAWVAGLTVAPAATGRAAAVELEQLGYDTLWYPEGLGTRESFTNGAVLLGATEHIRVASGIANIWGRDPVSAANAARVLDDAYGGRFLLGLGVSHPRQVDPRGHHYEKPVARMRAYLEAMDEDPFVSPDGSAEPRPPVPRVIAALRSPMLRLAGELALGAHSYLVPVEHTRRAREILGEGPLLVPEQKVILHPDRSVAYERAQAAIAWYLDTPNYVENLRWLGFGNEDFAAGGSRRLVEALVVWGNEAEIVDRVREHLDAGATQVAVQALGDANDPLGLTMLRLLAPALAELARPGSGNGSGGSSRLGRLM